MLAIQDALRAGFAVLALTAAAACSQGEAGHDAGGEEEHHHAHAAQFGGSLVELGDHYANLEFVCDAETGAVELYTWDAHVQTSQRSTTESLSLSITPHYHGEEGEGVEPFTMSLAPRVTKTSGETVGDSSKFTGQHDSLKGLDHFSVIVAEVTLKGQTFTDVEFLHPADAHDHDEDHDDDHEGHDHGDEGDGHGE